MTNADQGHVTGLKAFIEGVEAPLLARIKDLEGDYSVLLERYNSVNQRALLWCRYFVALACVDIYLIESARALAGVSTI